MCVLCFFVIEEVCQQCLDNMFKFIVDGGYIWCYDYVGISVMCFMFDIMWVVDLCLYFMVLVCLMLVVCGECLDYLLVVIVVEMCQLNMCVFICIIVDVGYYIYDDQLEVFVKVVWEFLQ